MDDVHYQICTQCVMDTSDRRIQFDEHGVCNHCRAVEQDSRSQWSTSQRQRRLKRIVSHIQAQGRNKDADCLLGLSGGIDSSYLALKAHEFGLKPLLVHVDTGWNSELASRNIENVARHLKLDLVTEVIDWEEMRDLQRAFLISGVPNQDIPQDHAILASLDKVAKQEGLSVLLDGNNWSSESVLPKSWGHDNLDASHILAIHRRFGSRPLRHFPMLSPSDVCQLLFGVPKSPYERVSLLNLMAYDRNSAIKELVEEVHFQPYEGKHGESRFTRFFQGYILLNRFGYDKRRAHLSSLILSGQISRNHALAILTSPPYDDETLHREKSFVAKKLGFQNEELDDLLNQPLRQHSEYSSGDAVLQRVAGLAEQEARLRADIASTLRSADLNLGLRDPKQDFPDLMEGLAIVLYGTGQFGQGIHAGLMRGGYGHVIGFVDSTRGGTLRGLPVWSLEEYRSKHEPEHQILVCSQHAGHIAALLDSAGIETYHLPTLTGQSVAG